MECEPEPERSLVHPSKNGHVSQYVVGLKPKCEQAGRKAAGLMMYEVQISPAAHMVDD